MRAMRTSGWGDAPDVTAPPPARPRPRRVLRRDTARAARWAASATALLRRLAARPAAAGTGPAPAREHERRVALRALLAVARRAARQHLLLPRPVAVDRDPLAAELEREPVGARDVLGRRVARQVDRLRDPVVDVPLEGRLHPDVALGRDVVGRREEPPDGLGHALDAARAPHRADGRERRLRAGGAQRIREQRVLLARS